MLFMMVCGRTPWWCQRSRTIPACLAPSSWLRVGASARGTDQAGGAVSLIVILMVPVATFAAVVAMAVPQRLAAESSLEDAASDLAVLAAAWRDAQGREHGRLKAFFPACDPAVQPGTGDNAGFTSDLERACDALTHALLRDLGGHGFDPATIRGFYSGSLSTAEGGPVGWSLPCTARGGTLVTDAAHVGLVAHWTGPDWATAQAMPHGVPMGAEAIGRIARVGQDAKVDVPHPPCGLSLDLVPGRLAPTADGNLSPGRELAETVPTRTAFSG